MRLTLLCRFCLPFLAVAMMIVLFSSCDTTRKAVYFRNLPKDTTLKNLITRPLHDTIQSGDFLTITVTSLSPENTNMYNAAPNSLGEVKGYQVDESGNIVFFKLGTVKAAGLSKTQFSDQLQKQLEPYLNQNTVNVSIANRHITLMGAISPKVMPLTKDMTLLDAIAESGDIGPKGKNDNILVIREKDGGKEREFKRLRLNDQSIFYSPYFYLQPNDIVYVEPKGQTMQIMQIASFVMTTVTFVFFAINRFR